MCVCTPKAEVQKMLQLPLDFNSTSITESSWWHHPLMTAVRNQIKPKFFIFLQRRVPVGAEALDCPQTSAPSPPGPCPALMDLQRLHCLSGRSLCSPLHRRCFVPLHNLLPSLQASPRTSCSHSPGESSAVWLHASLWGTSDRSTPHVTNAIRGNMQLLHSLLPRVARQGQFVTEASPLSPESWWYLQVSLSLPPSQELACGTGCPEAPGGWGGGEGEGALAEKDVRSEKTKGGTTIRSEAFCGFWSITAQTTAVLQHLHLFLSFLERLITGFRTVRLWDGNIFPQRKYPFCLHGLQSYDVKIKGESTLYWGTVNKTKKSLM